MRNIYAELGSLKMKEAGYIMGVIDQLKWKYNIQDKISHHGLFKRVYSHHKYSTHPYSRNKAITAGKLVEDV